MNGHCCRFSDRLTECLTFPTATTLQSAADDERKESAVFGICKFSVAGLFFYVPARPLNFRGLLSLKIGQNLKNMAKPHKKGLLENSKSPETTRQGFEP